MNLREERGKQIAEAGKVFKRKQTEWLVRSQSSNGSYLVNLANVDEPGCSVLASWSKKMKWILVSGGCGTPRFAVTLSGRAWAIVAGVSGRSPG
jgi:hypothetical protein